MGGLFFFLFFPRLPSYCDLFFPRLCESFSSPSSTCWVQAGSPLGLVLGSPFPENSFFPPRLPPPLLEGLLRVAFSPLVSGQIPFTFFSLASMVVFSRAFLLPPTSLFRALFPNLSLLGSLGTWGFFFLPVSPWTLFSLLRHFRAPFPVFFFYGSNGQLRVASRRCTLFFSGRSKFPRGPAEDAILDQSFFREIPLMWSPSSCTAPNIFAALEKDSVLALDKTSPFSRGCRCFSFFLVCPFSFFRAVLFSLSTVDRKPVSRSAFSFSPDPFFFPVRPLPPYHPLTPPADQLVFGSPPSPREPQFHLDTSMSFFSIACKTVVVVDRHFLEENVLARTFFSPLKRPTTSRLDTLFAGFLDGFLQKWVFLFPPGDLFFFIFPLFC